MSVGERVAKAEAYTNNVPGLGVTDAHGFIGAERVEVSCIHSRARVELTAAMVDSIDSMKGFAFAALIVPRKPDLARHGLHAAIVGSSAKGGKRVLLLLRLGVGNVEEESEGEEADDGGVHACFVLEPPVRRV